MINDSTDHPLLVKLSIGLSGIISAGLIISFPFMLYYVAETGKINKERENQKYTSYILDTYDRNKDGCLDRKEVLSYVRNMYSLTKPDFSEENK